MIRVTVWNEFRHEKEMPEVAAIYPNGIHGAIADFLSKNEDMTVRTATLDEPEHGLTDEVLNAMECTAPYLVNAQVVVMKSDKVADYADVDAMKDLAVAVESGSAGDETATNNGFTNVTKVTAQADALMEVASGTADACIIDLTMAKAMTGDGTSYADLSIAAEMDREEYGIGFRKGSDMAQKVNDIIASLKDDGTLQALADKYGLSLID